MYTMFITNNHSIFLVMKRKFKKVSKMLKVLCPGFYFLDIFFEKIKIFHSWSSTLLQKNLIKFQPKYDYFKQIELLIKS